MVSRPEEHDEVVDSETEAARRRHPEGQRFDVVRVAADALDVRWLLVEAALLFLRVVDLRVRVAEPIPAAKYSKRS